MKLIIKFFILLILITACNKRNPQYEDSVADAVSRQIESQVSDLQHDIKFLENQIDYINLRLKLVEDSYATFDLTDPAGFQKINSTSGFFYISVDQVKEHLDGYRVTLRIGNPLAAIFDDITLHAWWGDTANPYKKEAHLTQQLKAATWNTIDIQLSPMKKVEDLKNINLSIEAGSVQLIKD